MNPAASEPALSEVEGTAARKRNIFAKTTILYACSTMQDTMTDTMRDTM